MFPFVLFFASGFIQILGRPYNEVIQGDDSPWPIDKNMFLLPRILNVDEKINVTIKAKKTTKTINISLIAEHSSSDNTLSTICTFNADISTETVNVTNSELTDFKVMDIASFYPSEFAQNDSELSIFVQFRRRKNLKKPIANNIIEIGAETDSKIFEVNHLDKMRYLKFSGDDATVSNIEFEFK